MDERITPAYVTDNDTGVRYELDFNRESVVFAENHEFNLEKLREYTALYMPDFFYYAFRMHHRNVPRDKVDKMREKWVAPNGDKGAVPVHLATRLVNLYQQAQNSVVMTEEDAEKNSNMTVEL